ncbi:hypothetical protein [Microbacterium sp. TPU 3598]|uniref:hypothetical protein n=1 Tax=Microbacterium sp. TPU 3598 TaxID=1938334 RepID=UPI0012FD9906|nr:hypothetical protein [Microbacterium sp. TPU 3598]
MHVCDDLVDFGPLGLDALASLRGFCPAALILCASPVTVLLRLESRRELILPDRPTDEPNEPRERVALVGGVDVDAQSRAVFVDELEDLADGPASLDESFSRDDAADLPDVAAADPLEIGPPIGQLHVNPLGCAA